MITVKLSEKEINDLIKYLCFTKYPNADKSEIQNLIGKLTQSLEKK